MKYTFENFLQDRFIKQRELGGMPITKDNCEDMFDTWLSNLDGEEYIEYADLFARGEFLRGQAVVIDKLQHSV